MTSKDNTFSVKTTEESSGFLLWQVTTLWQRRIKQSLEPYGITHAQFVLLTSLHWLILHNQDVTQVVLSNFSKIDPMTTSTVLRNLQERGFISRKEHATDTRAKKITITKQGKELIKNAIVTVEQIDRDFFSLLGNEKVGLLNEILAELQQNGE